MRAKSRILTCLVCLAWLACSAGREEAAEPSGASAPARPPNIVLLIGDDHGHPYFGFMGDPIVKTPNLDRLAAAGTVFTHGFDTSSECRRSLATLLTGLYPHQWNVRNEALRQAGYPLLMYREIGHYETLPGLLGRTGYQSFQAGKLWEGTFRTAGFQQGMKTDVGKTLEEHAGGAAAISLGRTTMRPVLDFIAEHADEPFFLWFAPQIPHLPHDPPERFLALYDGVPLSASARSYYAMISWYDALAGEVVDAVRDAGLQDETLFVYLSDNGWVQEPGVEREVSDFEHFEILDKGKLSLFEQGFRTPIVFTWPGRLPAGAVRSDLVSTVDLFPTLLGFAGVAPPAGVPGLDLRDAIVRGEPVPRDRIIGTLDVAPIHPDHRPPDFVHPAGFPGPGYFMRDARWYYLAYERFEIEALYDVRDDPAQSRNVIALHPDVASRMRSEIESWLAETSQPFESVPEWEDAPRDSEPAR